MTERGPRNIISVSSFNGIGLGFLNEVEGDMLEGANSLAEDVFEILLNMSDDMVLGGNISVDEVLAMDLGSDIKNDPNLGNYIKILNGLFDTANRSEIGAIRNLTPKLVFDLNIIAAARAKCTGVSDLLGILCEVVNKELQDRAPSLSLLGADSVRSFALGDELSGGEVVNLHDGGGNRFL